MCAGIQADMHKCMDARRHAWIHAWFMRASAHAHQQNNQPPYTHALHTCSACTHACRHFTYIQAGTHTYMHKRIYAHACIHANMHWLHACTPIQTHVECMCLVHAWMYTCIYIMYVSHVCMLCNVAWCDVMWCVMHVYVWMYARVGWSSSACMVCIHANLNMNMCARMAVHNWWHLLFKHVSLCPPSPHAYPSSVLGLLFVTYWYFNKVACWWNSKHGTNETLFNVWFHRPCKFRHTYNTAGTAKSPADNLIRIGLCWWYGCGSDIKQPTARRVI